MPANRKNLTWMEITDFTPGLFGETNLGDNQVLMPPNAFARLQCYYPLKQGGLRAFYKTAGSVTCTGRTAGSHGSNNEAPVGLFAHSAVGGDNLILVTHNSNDHKDRVYFYPGGCSAGAGPWCVADSSAAASSDNVNPPDFGFFYDGTIYYYVMVLRGKDTGVWTITYDSSCAAGPGLATNGYTQTIDSNKTGPLGINGARLLVGDGAIGAKLWWSREGTLTFDAPNHMLVAPNDQGAGLRGIVSMQPDQFIVMRGGATWVQFSGDIGSSGTNREMSKEHTGGGSFQQPTRVPGGIAFIEPGGYVYVTDGNTFENISPQMPAWSAQVLGAQASSQVVATGQLSWINGFLFAPDGKVYHWDTKSWFTLEDSTAQTSVTVDKLYYTIRTDGSPVNCISMFQGNGALRATCGNFQTAPFADKDGRNVEIREVQVFLQAYGAGTTAVCDIYDADDNLCVTRTPEGGQGFEAGRSMIRFLFPYPHDDYLSVRLCFDGQTGNEAPTIERVRIGFGQNNDILGV